MSRYGNYPNPDLCKKYGRYSSRTNIPIKVSCEGCETQQQRINIQRSYTLKKAIDYAKTNQKTVAIYQDPATREFQFIDADISAGYPVVQVVSPYFGLPA